jgi:hypothetical protein
VRIDPKFVPKVLHGRAGEVEGTPIPAIWHGDMAEWAAALRAVDLAQGSFTIAELALVGLCGIQVPSDPSELHGGAEPGVEELRGALLEP